MLIYFGGSYDLIKRSKIFSIEPSIEGKLGVSFTGYQSGYITYLNIVVNSKCRTPFPLGFNIFGGYDNHLQLYRGNKTRTKGPFIGVAIVTDGIELSYSQTHIKYNNGNDIHNISIKQKIGIKPFRNKAQPEYYFD